MRWIIRFAAFVLSLSLGTTLWHVMSRTGATFTQLVQKAQVQSKAQAQSVVQASLPVFSSGIQQDAPRDKPKKARSFSFVPSYPEFGTGFVNSETVVLRESPDASAPVVKRLKITGYATPQVLGATRDFLHVRFNANQGITYDEEEREQDYEGWTTWDSVRPDMSAIVMDAETGRVVARLPLNQGFNVVAGFAPDGSRAVFHSSGADGQGSVYEVRTADYTLARSLKLVDGYLESVFYGATDEKLYATIRADGMDSAPLSLVRINDDGTTENLMEFSEASVGFALSPDARTGFAIHQTDAPGYELKISVVDLQALSIRNSFTLQGDGYQSLFLNNFLVNRDGSELYVRLSRQQDVIAVVDTRTGLLVRALPGNLSSYSWASFGRGDLVGDSVLVSVVKAEQADEMHARPDRVWVGSEGRVVPEKDIECAVEAGDERYAVNTGGTRLFRLDNKNRVREKFTISRPELGTNGADNDWLSVFGLSASPNGRRIIMFVGVEQGC